MISSIVLTEHLELIETGSLTSDCLPIFLHEATHNWCAVSPVGNALAALHCRLRLITNALAISFDDQELRREFTELFLRFEAASIALRPIAEGLAMLCELDCYPPEFGHKLVSAPMWWTAPLTARGLPNSVVTDIVNTKLSEVRRSDQYLMKRANLLASDFSCADGGYLLGYMACKSVLWRLNETKRRLTADEFLKIARYVIFSDARLAFEIAAQHRTSPTALGRLIAERVSHRLSQFFLTDNVAARIAQLRNFSQSNSPEDFNGAFMMDVAGTELLRSHETDQMVMFNDLLEVKEWEAAIQNAWQQALLPDKLPWTIPPHIYDLNKYILARRELLWLCADDVMVKSRDGRISAHLPDGRWIDGSAEATENATEFEGVGSLNVILSIPGHFKLDVITVDGVPISIAGADNVALRGRETLLKIIGDRRSLEEEVNETRDRFESKAVELMGQPALSEFRESVKEDTFAEIAPLSISAMRGVDCARFCRSAASGGWFGILKDFDLVRALALISHCTAEGLPPKSVVEAFSDHELDFPECVKMIQSIATMQFGGGPLNSSGAQCVI
jgi:hypothetical protein